MNLFNCLLSSVPLLSRGWIVPVGGATPDRQKSVGEQPPTGSSNLPDRLEVGSNRLGVQIRIRILFMRVGGVDEEDSPFNRTGMRENTSSQMNVTRGAVQ